MMVSVFLSQIDLLTRRLFNIPKWNKNETPIEYQCVIRPKHIVANNWNIPNWLEKEVRERDKVCVYCGCEFTPAKVSKKSAASWEHIINNASVITMENIALCCCSCNASKGRKQLSIWLQSKYCRERGITPETVAPIIKKAIENGQ